LVDPFVGGEIRGLRSRVIPARSYRAVEAMSRAMKCRERRLVDDHDRIHVAHRVGRAGSEGSDQDDRRYVRQLAGVIEQVGQCGALALGVHCRATFIAERQAVSDCPDCLPKVSL
jgi:hypothetical protein